MNLTILLFLLLTIVSIGCESDSDSSATTKGLPTGNIVGRVILYDTLLQVMGDLSGAIVSVESSVYKATTDVNGTFMLRDIPIGTYSFFVDKEGFTPSKIFNIQHTGNGTFYLPGYLLQGQADAYLYKIPKAEAVLTLSPFLDTPFLRDSSWSDSSGIQHVWVLDTTLAASFVVGATIVSPPYPAIYFSKQPNIDPSTSSTFDYMQYTYRSGATDFATTIYRDSLITKGFASGQQIFVRSAKSYGGYYDIIQRVNHASYAYYSPVRSFILP
jgi:hypothetical protein